MVKKRERSLDYQKRLENTLRRRHEIRRSSNNSFFSNKRMLYGLAITLFSFALFSGIVTSTEVTLDSDDVSLSPFGESQHPYLKEYQCFQLNKKCTNECKNFCDNVVEGQKEFDSCVNTCRIINKNDRLSTHKNNPYNPPDETVADEICEYWILNC